MVMAWTMNVLVADKWLTDCKAIKDNDLTALEMLVRAIIAGGLHHSTA